MENNKIVLIVFLLILTACSFFSIETDGWHYLKNNDVNAAHKEFLRDYAYSPEDIINVSGLAYTYFLMDMPDSSLIYVNECRQIDNDTIYTLFSALTYYHSYSIIKADTVYRIFINEYGYITNQYIIDSLIQGNDMNKMGLISIYKNGDYDYVYGILQEITDIPDSFSMSNENHRSFLIDYINSL